MYGLRNWCKWKRVGGNKVLRFKSHWPKLLMKLNKVSYGKNLLLYGYPYVFRTGQGKITIGDNVCINSDPMSNMLGMTQRTYIITKRTGEISIGNNVGISGASIYAWDSIVIGDHTKIGSGVKIMDTDFHPVDPQARLEGRDAEATKFAPIKIGKNVFIGCNALILKGTTIGDNCVIGAGSVVHGVFEDNCVIAGNPAKVIKRL